MKIAFVTFEYPPHIVGGAGTYAHNITREIAKLGHEVVVITPGGRAYSPPPGVEVAVAPTKEDRPLGALQFWLNLPGTFRELEKGGPFDVVHFNGTSYWFLNKLSDGAKVVTIHHLAKDSIAHDRGVAVLLSLFERRAMSLSDRIVAVSEYTRGRIVDGHGVDWNKIAVVYNGSSYDASSPVETQEAEEYLGRLDGRKTVLFVGRVDDRRKGLDLLLKAMRVVADQEDAVLVVAGKGDQRETRKFSDELGLGNNVVYTGFIPDPFLLGLYRTCDVYVCPSRLEGFGITLLDAQLYAKRAVATKVGPIPEIASRDTLLVEPEDVEGMASAILRSLRPERAFSSISDEEDAAFKASFSWEKAARMVIEQYGLAVKGR